MTLNLWSHVRFGEIFYFDFDFYWMCMTEKTEREEQMDLDEYERNETLNSQISIAEVGVALQKAQNGKAWGIDSILNEVLKRSKSNCIEKYF